MQGTVKDPVAPGPRQDAEVPRAFVSIQDIDDPCVWELESLPWEVLGGRIAAPFRHQKRILVTPSWLLYSESFAGGLHIQGMTPAGMLGFSVPIRVGQGASFWGGPLHERGLPASLPGVVDARIEAGQSQLIVLVRLDWLRAQVDPLTYDGLERAALRRVLPATPTGREALGIWLLGLLARFHHAPGHLAEPAVVSSLEQDLLRWLLATVRFADTTSPRPMLNRRRRGFDRAIEGLRQVELATVDCSLLTTLAGVSRRTLEYAFQDEVGLSPRGFIYKLRLHAVRRALLAADPAGATVGDIAAAHGFYQFGRFAGDYRSAFGELPSVTLRRPCAAPAGGLLRP
jgi:AraC family ethanolamine operon transcriptional activator